MKFLVTGGAGFIGSAFVRLLLEDPKLSRRVVNLDKLTYAGNLENLTSVATQENAARYRFVHGDICDAALVNSLVADEKPDVMVKFKCDVHSWMTSYAGVLEHPFYSVTGEDGAFSLKNLPAGEYEVVAWHEKYGEQSAKVKVGDGESKTQEFKFKKAE